MRFMLNLFEFSWHSIAFIVITLLWWLEFRIFPSTGAKRSDAGTESFKLILAAIILTILISIVSAILGLGTLTGTTGQIIQIIGLIFYFLGLVLRYWCSYLLGIYFTRGVTVQEGQELVSVGPYRILRHPLYLGLLLLTIGVPLYFSSLLTLIPALPLLLWAINKRIILEEDKLTATLGDKYTTWKRDRYRLIPFIY